MQNYCNVESTCVDCWTFLSSLKHLKALAAQKQSSSKLALILSSMVKKQVKYEWPKSFGPCKRVNIIRRNKTGVDFQGTYSIICLFYLFSKHFCEDIFWKILLIWLSSIKILILCFCHTFFFHLQWKINLLAKA